MSRRPTMQEMAAAMRETDARLVSAEITLLEYRKALLKQLDSRRIEKEPKEPWLTKGF